MSYFLTEDWFTSNIPIWNSFLSHLKDKPNLNFLEIGSFQGRSAIWLLENILTHPTSKITCIDTFEGSIENTPEQTCNLFSIFCSNLSKFGDKVIVYRGYSQNILKEIWNQYDFIYIDGDHRAPSVLTDAVLAFPLLKSGGILIFDDYEWNYFPDPRPVNSPKLAIESFINVFSDHLRILNVGYQIILQKI